MIKRRSAASRSSGSTGFFTSPRAIRLTLAGLLVLGGILPVVLAPKYQGGYRAAWSWDALDAFGHAKLFSGEFMLALFFMLPPLIGILTFVFEAIRNRVTRASIYIVIGSLPLLVLILTLMQTKNSGFTSLETVVGLALLGAMLLGVIVARLRPSANLGYYVLGAAGCVALLLTLIPIAPDLSKMDVLRPGRLAGVPKTLPLLNTFHALNVPKIGWFISLAGLISLATHVLAASTLFRTGREKRSGITLWLIVASLGIVLLLPMVVAMLGSGNNVVIPVSMIIVSFFFLRIYPAVGLTLYGTTSFILDSLDGNAEGGASKSRRGGSAQQPSFERCCEGLERAAQSRDEGTITPEDFNDRKVKLLRAAIRDARSRNTWPDFKDRLQDLTTRSVITLRDLQGVARNFESTP